MINRPRKSLKLSRTRVLKWQNRKKRKILVVKVVKHHI